MWKTQRQFEETVTVYNEGSPTRGSGGIAIISDGTSLSIKMLMLPDYNIHVETKKEGQSKFERVYAQISKIEMDKISIIPGKTKVIWNGNTYKVTTIIDYTLKPLFQLAEIEMRRQLEYI